MMIAEVARDTNTYTRGNTLRVMGAFAVLVLLYLLITRLKAGRSAPNNQRPHTLANGADRRAVGPAALANRRSSRRQASLGANSRRPKPLGRPRPQATERSRRRSATVVTPQYRRPDFTVVIDGVEFEGWHR